ncbi:MAG: hypothetical protein KJ804_15090 [Proteobacteria bacterium]|nr:hypothetical protein [Pseudomonadota bacterium]MBU1059635.1 hypothetical protein [Pseudomonadota bacterium]
MKFTEARLEQAIIALLEEQGYPHHRGDILDRVRREMLRKPASSRIVQDCFKVKGEA